MPASEIIFPAGRAERERAYSPSSCIYDIAPFIARYVAESAGARDLIPYRTERYGSSDAEALDIFEPANPLNSGPVHLFFHGGYWQELSKAEASFPAISFSSTGVTYVAAGYTLAPHATVPQIIDQARTAARWVLVNVCNGDASRLTVSGSSAGAHLAAWVALRESVHRAVLLSGVYDLQPLVGTYINDELGMDVETARSASPLLALPPVKRDPAFTIVWGEIETEAFKQQSRVFAAALEERGAAVELREITGRNHFDIVHDLPEIAGVYL
ncbi:MAG: alpha/beta hydrolase [Acidimicrobiales bacterium]|nr:alpha/beta hydrolase [Acidimicrobiales bacterium]